MKLFEKSYQLVAKNVTSWSTKKFLVFIILFQIITHLPIVPLPPMGQHTWRQVMGLAPARNFYEENHFFLNPAQDIRIEPEDQGETYFEFPLLYWLIGQSYYLTGFSHANGRIAMLIMGILLILGSYKLVRNLGFDEIRARWYVFFLSCAPFFFYYSISVSPNMPALTWFVWGLAFIVPKLKAEIWDLFFWLGIGLIILGTISKATYLFFGLPIAFLFINQYLNTRNIKVLIIGFIALFFVFLINGLLYVHSLSLKELAPFERQVHAFQNPVTPPITLTEWYAILRPAIVEWFLQMVVNTAAVPFFIVGTYTAIQFKKWRTFQGKFWISWLASFLIFFLCFSTQFRQHSYYMESMLLIAPLGSAFGVDYLVKHKRWFTVAVVLLFFVPIVMIGRVGHRWLWAKQVPDELIYQSAEFEAIIPKDDRVIVIGDNSPVIYLYYLHRKGVSIGKAASRDDIQKYKKVGFKWVVTDEPVIESAGLKGEIDSIKEIGKFSLIRLNSNIERLN